VSSESPKKKGRKGFLEEELSTGKRVERKSVGDIPQTSKPQRPSLVSKRQASPSTKHQELSSKKLPESSPKKARESSPNKHEESPPTKQHDAPPSKPQSPTRKQPEGFQSSSNQPEIRVDKRRKTSKVESHSQSKPTSSSGQSSKPLDQSNESSKTLLQSDDVLKSPQQSSERSKSSRQTSPSSTSTSQSTENKCSEETVKSEKSSEAQNVISEKRTDSIKVPPPSSPTVTEIKQEDEDNCELQQILETVDPKAKSPVPIRLPTKCKSKAESDSDSDSKSTKSSTSSTSKVARVFKKTFKGKAIAIVKPFSNAVTEKKSPSSSEKKQKEIEARLNLYEFGSDESESPNAENSQKKEPSPNQPSSHDSDDDVDTTKNDQELDSTVTKCEPEARDIDKNKVKDSLSHRNSVAGSIKGVKRIKSIVSTRRLKFNNPELKAVRVRVEKLHNRFLSTLNYPL
jgi:hypothetical protein